ncbi:LOW QUALITY PROTEIN: hypothetical protein U9M48_032008 [Paspalum notatum var. saurae]|uniref:Integrase catalytic domain-containing protein n=1 Tax=Paspalum notatum var. saurae TaxID=547442 RepID=A0AAQ3X504_PASNO
MDSGCSRHMTGHRRWFSNLNPMDTKEYITFRDNGQGKVLGVGLVSLSTKLSLREVAFVRNLGFNLVSVSQLLNEGFEVRFKKGACHVLDPEETLVFRVDLTSVSGPARCLVASPSADIWLSSMGLIRGLPKLKAEKDLVCHSCRHGKMVAASHTLVMTSYPSELLHIDTVVPAQVASVSGKWYVLVVVDDFSRFSWVFFMEVKDEAFGFVWDLALRLRNKSHKAMGAIRSNNGGEFKNSRFDNFCCDLGLEQQFFLHIPLLRMVLWNARTTHSLRWHGLCSMSIGLLDIFGLRQRIRPVTLQTGFFCELPSGRPRKNFGLPSVKHMRPFGYRFFVFKKVGHMDKFESRCQDGVFLGYTSSSRAF